MASFVLEGTPGYKNSVSNDINYSAISIVEFIPDPHGNDDDPMPNGEWIELFNSGGQDINLKWAFFEDMQGHQLYITDMTTNSTTIQSNGFLVVYMNGFSGFLNNDGAEEIKFSSPNSTLIEEISYEGSDEGSSWALVGDNWQKTVPTPNEENEDYTDVKESRFEIENVYDLGSDDIAKFGQTIRVKVNVYKGDDTKSVLRMWVEGEHKISKESKITMSKKYTEVTLAVPIQLKPNCNNHYEDGSYEIFIGWTSEDNAEDSFPLKVEDITSSLCEKVEVEKSLSNSKSKFFLTIFMFNSINYY